MVTSCTTTVRYHKHNTEVDTVKMQKFPSLQGSLTCLLIAFSTSLAHVLALIFWDTVISLLLQKLPNINSRVILFLGIIPSYQKCHLMSGLNLSYSWIVSFPEILYDRHSTHRHTHIIKLNNRTKDFITQFKNYTLPIMLMVSYSPVHLPDLMYTGLCVYFSFLKLHECFHN